MMQKSSHRLVNEPNQTISETSPKAKFIESKQSDIMNHRRIYSNQSCKIGERVTAGIFSPQNVNRQRDPGQWLNTKKHQVKVQDVI